MHLHFPPNGVSGILPDRAVRHWNVPLVPVAAHRLVESVEDTLAHVAECLPHEAALILWESAMRKEGLHSDAIRRVPWRSATAQRCAEQAQGLSDSGLETIFVDRMRPWGLPLRQQVVLAGRPVDALIAELLVVQLDGFAHHSSSADRTRDLAHDAELRLRGYTVLRFSYSQVLHDWRFVERTLLRAIAAGAHLGEVRSV